MLTLLLLAFTALAQDTEEPVPEKQESWERTGFGWGALPAINYNSDEGLGFGAVANLYRYDGSTSPYRYNIGAQFFMTTRGIHKHRLEIDALKVANTPLRLTGRVELVVTRAGNFCGFGHDVTCDTTEATAAVDAAGLTGEEREDALTHYYQVRFVRPFAVLTARYALNEMPHRLEIFASWRGEWHQPGDFTSTTPYPTSRYKEVFPDGEKGFLSVLQAGVMLDNRDNESAPSQGYWVEAGLRGASPYWGSSWSHFGVNATLRAYVPITTDKRLVLATRYVFDGFVGNAPTREWGTPGGAGRLYEAFGSLNAGRGIRARRYIGRVKTFLQPELRWTFVKFNIGSLPIALTALGFSDIGVASQDWSSLGAAFGQPIVGVGGGLRVAIDQNFIVRVDMGVSAKEDWSPSLYIDLRNVF